MLDLNPFTKTFDNKSIDIKVATNNATGYQLFMSTSNNKTTLDRDNSDGLGLATIDTLPTLSSGYDKDSFIVNKWGYRILASTTDPDKITSNYYPFILDNHIATNHTTTNGDNTTINFAAKIDNNQPAGTYTNTLVFNAVATYAAYTVEYYNGYDNSSTIATQSDSYNTMSTIKLNPINPSTGGTFTPTRDTYGFLGWCDTPDINEYYSGTSCIGNTYQAGNDIDIDITSYANDIKLYAYWDPTTFDEAYAAAGKNKASNYYVMQDMSSDICNSVSINQVTQLIDTRSGNYVYYVAKLKDGKCWMTQNLRLGTNTTSLALTNSNSNITATSYTLNNKVANMPYTYITDDVTGGRSAIHNGNAYYCAPVTGNNYVGCYYNWYTATAGTGTSSVTGKNTTGGTDASSSICPKNWILPKGGPEGEFKTIYEQYPSWDLMLTPNKASDYDNTSGLPIPGYTLGAYYCAGGLCGTPGTFSQYYSRTAYSNGQAYILDFRNNQTVWTESPNNKYDARSIRCLAAY